MDGQEGKYSQHSILSHTHWLSIQALDVNVPAPGLCGVLRRPGHISALSGSRLRL